MDADLQKEVQPGKKRKRQPFPPKHYVASVDVLKTSDYDIPEMSATGDIICPEGYAATRPGDASYSELFCSDMSMQQTRGIEEQSSCSWSSGSAAHMTVFLLLAGPDGVEKQPELFGIDCEMCITAEGFELTRVSLINEQLEVSPTFTT